MRLIMRLGVLAAGGLLAGCLTSDGLLFDSRNARATPLASGLYAACSQEDGADDPECQDIDVSYDAEGLYRLHVKAEDETNLARFKSAGSGRWAAQLWEQGDDSPFYFLATRSGGTFALSMIGCADLPDSFKKKYIARGRLNVDEGTCVAKTAGTVVAAARAWSKTDEAAASRLVMTKKSG